MNRFREIIRRAIAVTSGFVLFSSPLAVIAERLPNDHYFDNQWYLRQIGAPKAWETSLGFEGVIVAVIDTGVDLDHPDLKDNIWRNADEVPGNKIDDDGNGYVDDVQGWDFVDNDADPRVDLSDSDRWDSGVSHGTVSAGVIAARGDNGIGISGVTWQTTVMPIRALDENGQGNPVSVVQAVEYAVRNGADVINLALAGAVEDDLLRIALRRAYDEGVFVVAASGNAPDGRSPVNLDSTPRYPVCLDFGEDENFVYGVAATDDYDKRVESSNFGAGCVDLSAPGYRFVSTVPYRKTLAEFSEAYRGYFSGTSVAASLVSGSVALIKALDPHLTPKQMANLLTETAANVDAANPEYFGRLGRGRLDVAAAVARLMSTRQSASVPVSTSTLVPGGRVSGLIVAASGEGRENEIRLFTGDGALVRSWRPFGEGFRGGADVAVADFDGKGRQSIIAAAGPGGTPQVRIFDVNTIPIGGIMAYDGRFRGGISLATGDLDGNGEDEIVTVPQGGGGPHVRIFSNRGAVIGGFFAFGENERHGWNVAVSDVGGDRVAEIIVMRRDGSAVRVYSGRGELLGEFAPDIAPKGCGLGLLAVDSGDDGMAEIGVMSAAPSESLATYRLSGEFVRRQALSDGMIIGKARRYAFGALPGTAPVVRSATGSGRIFSFQAFEANFRGGVRAAMIE